MANQAIALQARAPQTDFMGRAIQQNAQMMNMMSQQRAAERQAAQAAQEMQMAQAKEARDVELHGPAMDKARAEATAQGIKTALDFSNFVYTGLSNAADPAQATQITQRIGQQPQFQEELFQGTLADAIATMPNDPAEFAVWKEETLAQTLDSAERLKRKLIEQTSGSEQRVISVPEYGRGAATEVPGSRIAAPAGITYVKDAEGNIIPMPKTMPGTGGPVGGTPSAPAGAGGDTFSRMIDVESRGQQFDRSGKPLTSRAGAIGVAQVMPGTAPEAARLAGLPFDDERYRNDPEYNLALGKAYYEKQLADFGDERLAAAAYNAGPGAIRRALQKGGPDGWINHVPRETQNYVRDVFGGAGGPTIRFGEPAVKGGQRKLTEQEQTASYNINRVLRAARVIAEASERSAEANAPGGLEAFVASTPLISGLVNFTRSEDRQIVAAAQRDLIDALLYLSTGAAYNKEQLEGQMESYLPQYSDAPGARESKRQRLAQLVKDAKSRAGRAWTPELDAAAEALYAKTFSGAGGKKKSLGDVFGGR